MRVSFHMPRETLQNALASYDAIRSDSGAAAVESLAMLMETVRLVLAVDGKPAKRPGPPFEAPFYYSYDDLHNRPYISGPWTEEELRERVTEVSIDELLEEGYAEDMGERYRLHSPATHEREIASMSREALKMAAGERLP